MVVAECLKAAFLDERLVEPITGSHGDAGIRRGGRKQEEARRKTKRCPGVPRQQAGDTPQNPARSWCTAVCRIFEIGCS